jgi:RHS repeat-associated protein
LGSVSNYTDGGGSSLVAASYNAFGDRRGSNWAGDPTSGELSTMNNLTRRGFTEHEMLDSSGLVHMNGRAYSPIVGRFVGADPYLDLAVGTQGWNRYSYIGNRALSATDPTGFNSNIWRDGMDFFERWWDSHGVTIYDSGRYAVASYDSAGWLAEVVLSADRISDPFQGFSADLAAGLWAPELGGVFGGLAPADGWLGTGACGLIGLAIAIPAPFVDTSVEATALMDYFMGRSATLFLTSSQMNTLRATVAANPLLVGEHRALSDGRTVAPINAGSIEGQFDALLGQTTGIFENGALVEVRDFYNMNPQPLGDDGRGSDWLEYGVRGTGWVAENVCSAPGYPMHGQYGNANLVAE